jgi:hypothetical protein
VTFASTSIAYPMRLTATADVGPALKLFVLRRTGCNGPARWGRRTPTCSSPGWVEPSPAGAALAGLLDRRMFLTRFDQQIAPASVTDDYRFEFAEGDTGYRTVVYETEPVYLIGWTGAATRSAPEPKASAWTPP